VTHFEDAYRWVERYDLLYITIFNRFGWNANQSAGFAFEVSKDEE